MDVSVSSLYVSPFCSQRSLPTRYLPDKNSGRFYFFLSKFTFGLVLFSACLWTLMSWTFTHNAALLVLSVHRSNLQKTIMFPSNMTHGTHSNEQ